MGIAVAPDGERVYVGVFLPDRSGRLEVIDTDKRTVIASVPIGVRPFQVLASRDGRTVYTVDHDTFTRDSHRCGDLLNQDAAGRAAGERRMGQLG